MGEFERWDEWGELDTFRQRRPIPKGAVWVDQYGQAYYHTDAIDNDHLVNIIRWLERKMEVYDLKALQEMNPLLSTDTLSVMVDAAKLRGLPVT